MFGLYPSADAGLVASPGGVQSPLEVTFNTSPKQSPMVLLAIWLPSVDVVKVPICAAHVQFAGEVELSVMVQLGSAEKLTVIVIGEPSEFIVTLYV